MKGDECKYPKQRERYYRLRAAGICVDCGKLPAVNGHHCAKHRERHTALVNARRERLRASGRCVTCGKKALKDATLCARCRKINIESTRRCTKTRSALRRSLNLCTKCGRDRGDPVHVKHVRKEAALQFTRNFTRIRYGICVECGLDKIGGGSRRVCVKCARKNRKRANASQALALAAGLCRQCRKPRGANGTTNYCRPCADDHTQRQLDWLAKNGRAR